MARDRAEEIAVGKRFRSDYLVEQADYTEKLAKGDSAALAPLGVGKAVFDALADYRGKVYAARKDKTLASTDAHAATAGQDNAIGKAKSWLRKAILFGKNAYDGEATAREFDKGGPTGTSVPKLAGKIKDVLTLLRRDADLAGKHGATKDFLKTGDDLLAALMEADASQEHKKASIPKATEEFMIEKARLYFLLKQINRAGEALWMDDPVRKDAYNLHILHRRGTKRGKDAPADGAAEPEVKG